MYWLESHTDKVAKNVYTLSDIEVSTATIHLRKHLHEDILIKIFQIVTIKQNLGITVIT